MWEKSLKIKLSSAKNCFSYLSSNYLHKGIEHGDCFRLKYGNQNSVHVSINPTLTNVDDDTLVIPIVFAKELGIQAGDVVVLTKINKLHSVKSFTISPVTKEDYEILEILADNVQSTLLNQISVIEVNRKFVIWIGENIHIPVFVSEVKPSSPACIYELTEVIIKPPISLNKDSITFKPESIGDTSAKQDCTEIDSFIVKNFIKLIEGYRIHDICFPELQSYFDYKSNLIFRLTPFKNYNLLEDFLHPFNVFVSKNSLSNNWSSKNSFNTPIICAMKLLTDDEFSQKVLYVRLCFLEDFFDNFNEVVYKQNILVSDSIFDQFECKIGSRVILKYTPNKSFVSEIQICCKKNYLVDIEEKFKKYLADCTDKQTIVLNPTVPLCLGNNLYCFLKFLPIESKFCIVDDDFVRNCKYSVHDEVVNVIKSKPTKSIDYTMNASNYEEILENITWMYNLKHGKVFENSLLIGKPGCGKSTLLHIIKEKLDSAPYFIYTEVINCKSLKGKTNDSLMKLISDCFTNLVFHQPSVLILDDLQVLCEYAKDEAAQNSLHLNRISEILYNLFKSFNKTNTIGIIATTDSLSKLNSNIYSSRGTYLFKNIYNINDLNKIDRLNLLKYFSKKYNTNNVDFEAFSIKTEGFVIQDVENIVNRAIYEAYKDEDCTSNVKPVLEHHHFETALQNTSVLSLHDVKLHSPGDKNFSDVGGMEDVKKILIESLMWPAQYPSIFTDAPLRLQSGLLLYGLPGTGKTLLAGAAAQQCGLRLISVKGPELLSKYIGASEQAVRDVFEKAQSARPCILFFDEFDSLAPRRGHDNTGVTDRVVNQLLTQLDGVESLTGVCVLAATSRPDLLDPALLRPGRLDRQLLCPLPDQDARLDILKALSKSLKLSSDVDLSELAEKTDGFTGADLQSILYTAQLSTVEHLLLENSDEKEVEVSSIKQTHLIDALRKTRPSLTKQERRKYERIYSSFESGGMENFKPGSKATLA